MQHPLDFFFVYLLYYYLSNKYRDQKLTKKRVYSNVAQSTLSLNRPLRTS